MFLRTFYRGLLPLCHFYLNAYHDSFFVSITTLPLIANANVIDDFNQCINKMKVQASSGGFSDFIVNDVIPTLSPLKKVITLDQRQPEFSQSFADYLKLRLTNYHIEIGRKKLSEHKVLFDKLSKKVWCSCSIFSRLLGARNKLWAS